MCPVTAHTLWVDDLSRSASMRQTLAACFERLLSMSGKTHQECLLLLVALTAKKSLVKYFAFDTS